jgi:release factor glutamine methyltransferase
LDEYRILVPQLRSLLLPNGAAVLEIGATQAEAVSQIAATAGFSVVTHNDLAGRPRALVLRLGLGKAGRSG